MVNLPSFWGSGEQQSVEKQESEPNMIKNDDREVPLDERDFGMGNGEDKDYGQDQYQKQYRDDDSVEEKELENDYEDKDRGRKSRKYRDEEVKEKDIDTDDEDEEEEDERGRTRTREYEPELADLVGKKTVKVEVEKEGVPKVAVEVTGDSRAMPSEEEVAEAVNKGVEKGSEKCKKEGRNEYGQDEMKGTEKYRDEEKNGAEKKIFKDAQPEAEEKNTDRKEKDELKKDRKSFASAYEQDDSDDSEDKYWSHSDDRRDLKKDYKDLKDLKAADENHDGDLIKTDEKDTENTPTAEKDGNQDKIRKYGDYKRNSDEKDKNEKYPKVEKKAEDSPFVITDKYHAEKGKDGEDIAVDDENSQNEMYPKPAKKAEEEKPLKETPEVTESKAIQPDTLDKPATVDSKDQKEMPVRDTENHSTVNPADIEKPQEKVPTDNTKAEKICTAQDPSETSDLDQKSEPEKISPQNPISAPTGSGTAPPANDDKTPIAPEKQVDWNKPAEKTSTPTVVLVDMGKDKGRVAFTQMPRRLALLREQAAQRAALETKNEDVRRKPIVIEGRGPLPTGFGSGTLIPKGKAHSGNKHVEVPLTPEQMEEQELQKHRLGGEEQKSRFFEGVLKFDTVLRDQEVHRKKMEVPTPVEVDKKAKKWEPVRLVLPTTLQKKPKVYSPLEWKSKENSVGYGKLADPEPEPAPNRRGGNGQDEEKPRSKWEVKPVSGLRRTIKTGDMKPVKRDATGKALDLPIVKPSE